jgi:DNA-binding NarL/FixJ family response regulator
MASLLLVEDHPAVAQAFTRYLERQEGLKLERRFGSAEALLAWLEGEEAAAKGVDVVLVDLSLPGMDGITLVKALQESYPQIACIVLSGYRDKHLVRQAFTAGARGYVVKDELAQVVTAIRHVLAGELFRSDMVGGSQGSSYPSGAAA